MSWLLFGFRFKITYSLFHVDISVSVACVSASATISVPVCVSDLTSFCVMVTFLCHDCSSVSWLLFCVMIAFLCHDCFSVSWLLFCVMIALLCHDCFSVSWLLLICVMIAFLCHDCFSVSWLHFCVVIVFLYHDYFYYHGLFAVFCFCFLTFVFLLLYCFHPDSISQLCIPVCVPDLPSFCVMVTFLCHGYFSVSWLLFCVMIALLCHDCFYYHGLFSVFCFCFLTFVFLLLYVFQPDFISQLCIFIWLFLYGIRVTIKKIPVFKLIFQIKFNQIKFSSE